MRPHWVVGVAVALTLSACGGQAVSTTAGDTASTAASATTGGGSGVAVPPILDFKAAALSSGAITGDQFVGRPVAFWFWAPG